MKKQFFLSIIWMLCIGIGVAVTASCTPKKNHQKVHKTATPIIIKKDKKNDKASEKLSAKYLKQRVEKIYKKVCELYRNVDDIDDTSIIVEQIYEARLEENYCSNDWNTKMEEVSIINNTIHKDDYPYPDGDYWIMGQEWNDVSVKDVRVEEIDGCNAIVSFKLHNYGSITPVKLDMVFERDDWFIDNFHNFIDNSYEDSEFKGRYFDWKKDMDKYISESKNLINENNNEGNHNTNSTADHPINYNDQPYTVPSVGIYQEDNTPSQPIKKQCLACRNNPGICASCEGLGKVKHMYNNSTGEWIMTNCRLCGGNGMCCACKGDGWLDEGIDF